MLKKFLKESKDAILELIMYEYKYLLLLFLLAIICYMPLNYYIIVGGGISDISSRVKVNDGYKSKGSFNISYVTETDGVLLTYVLSYIMPNWKRVDIADYKYEENEDTEDINFRNDLSLKQASNDAMKVAYTKAGKSITLKDSKYYVISKVNNSLTKLEVGDQIISIDGNKIDEFDYSSYINGLKEGASVIVKVVRNQKEIDVKTSIIKENDRKLLGIYLTKLNEYNAPKKVNIKFKKSESGPSGGVITALSIYDQLVKKDITKGLTIAGTGTIDSEGNVGEIGGVEYKLRGAIAGGADVFIVPNGDNYKEVMKLVKKEKYNIKVLGVSTFDETLEKLSSL